ncbi:MAG TPA: alpha-2-macroglobulin family protein, partial [Anaeromyxobacter sp.]
FKPAKENAQFAYGPRGGRAGAKPVSLGSAQGTLDAKGKARIACPPGAGAFAGPARVVATAAVFEGGSGRSTVSQAFAPVHPERFYVGLQSAVRRAEPNRPIPVKGVLVDWNGALATRAARELTVELVRLEPEYGWWWDEERGGERFERHLRPVSEGATKVPVAEGRFAIDLVPRESGAGYLVRARAGQAVTELEVEGESRGGYLYADGPDRREQTPRPLRPTSLALDLPRSVKAGEKASVKVAIPFRGRALLTVETDRVVSAEWRKVEAGELAWGFTVPSFAPNAYLSLFVVKDPHLESAQAFMPDRAFGVGSVPVEPVEFTAPMKLALPAEVRSSSPLVVKLDVGRTEGPTVAVVAAVDEGILQLTRMKSPDPHAAIFAKRALGVDTFETIGWSLLLPPQGPSRATGGDAGGAAGRVQPVKPVALWSGVVPVSADGKAEVTFQVPRYRGQLRVMAVSAGPKRMGRASASVTVKDPIVLSTTLPRFVTQGDLLQVPVFLTNLSGAPQEVEVSLSAEALPVPGVAPAPAPAPPLVFVGRSEGSVTLADGASRTLVFQVRAAIAAGAARLRVAARAGAHESHEELDVPFLPAGPRERIVKRIEAGEGTVDLGPHLRGWVATSERSTVWLTGNPYGESFDHLQYLLHYPYGCVEQTTSSTRPLLFVGNLLDNVDPAYTAGGKIEEMVLAGVQRLLSMQTPSGGLAYWPGETEPFGWGTAYATHLLVDAQRAGFAVPQDRLDEILKWIEGEVARRERGEDGRDGYHDGP